MKWYKKANQQIGKPFNLSEAENAASRNGVELENTEKLISLPVDFEEETGDTLIQVSTPAYNHVTVYYTKSYEPHERSSREHPESGGYFDINIEHIVLGNTDITELVDPKTMSSLQAEIADSEHGQAEDAEASDLFDRWMESRNG